jgi:hypothetical protein
VPLSPLLEDEQPLTPEAGYLVAQLREPTCSEEQAIAMTLENYPALTEDETRSWWRVGAFRRAVREAREVAKGYAAEDAAGGAPIVHDRAQSPDAYAVPAEEAFSGAAGTRSSWFAWLGA